VTDVEQWPDLLAYYSGWLGYRQWYLRTPGVQAAVRRQGELALSTASGVADLSTGEALTPSHLFRIASHSKSFASVTVLQLVERGQLRLDDRLGTLVAELADSPVADRTVRELLSHSGGVIRDSEDGDFWQRGRPFPDRAELIDIAHRPSAAVFDRNERYKYSNIGFGLVGLVIEAAGGVPFATWLESSIAGPLGLTDTGGELDLARAADYAAGHSALAYSRERQVIAHVDTRALAAATGCFSTAADLTAFYSALLPGDTRLLSEDAKREQRHRHWAVKEDEGYGFGLALTRIAKIDVFGHSGGYPGHITCTYAEPEDGWVVSVLTNAIDGPASTLAAAFFHLLDLGRHADHARSEVGAQRFTGRFSWLWGVADVMRVADRLFLVNPAQLNPAEDAVALEVVDDTSLRMVGGTGGNAIGELIHYDFDADGVIRSVRGSSGMSMAPFRHDPGS
jgi:CubicO group peptidase (beta-lactamase class C family)